MWPGRPKVSGFDAGSASARIVAARSWIECLNISTICQALFLKFAHCSLNIFCAVITLLMWAETTKFGLKGLNKRNCLIYFCKMIIV